MSRSRARRRRRRRRPDLARIDETVERDEGSRSDGQEQRRPFLAEQRIRADRTTARAPIVLIVLAHDSSPVEMERRIRHMNDHAPTAGVPRAPPGAALDVAGVHGLELQLAEVAAGAHHAPEGRHTCTAYAAECRTRVLHVGCVARRDRVTVLAPECREVAIE